MTPLQLEQCHQIPAFETDIASLWRPEAIFRAMQELAILHCEQLGYGRDALLARDIVWMLARTHLRMERYARLHDTVRITTWSGATGRITYPRYFTLEDARGAQIGCAATSWLLVDIKTRRILPPGKAQLVFPDTAQLVPPLPEPQRFPLTLPGDPLRTERMARYAEVDMNGHMNNASYIGWLCDLFPLERHQSGRIRELCISYAAEALPQERVELLLREQGNSFEVMGRDALDGHTVFEAKGEWAANG